MKNAVVLGSGNGLFGLGRRQGKITKKKKGMKYPSAKISSSSTILIMLHRQMHSVLAAFALLAAGSMAMPGNVLGASIPLNETFELDGDIAATAPNPPDDWGLLYNGGLETGGAAAIYTGNIVDAVNAGDDTFTGGSKITQDPTEWAWVETTTSSASDKTDINNVAVALYTRQYNAAGVDSGPATNLFFRADVTAPNGDATISLWLFQNTITRVGTNGGTFTGSHINGDLLLESQFINGGGVAAI